MRSELDSGLIVQNCNMQGHPELSYFMRSFSGSSRGGGGKEVLPFLAG